METAICDVDDLPGFHIGARLPNSFALFIFL